MRSHLGMRSVLILILVLALAGCEETTQVTVRSGGDVGEPAAATLFVEPEIEANASSETVDQVSGTDYAEEVPEIEEDSAEELTGTVHTVKIETLRVKPKELTIKVGDTIIWKNNDKFEEGGVFHQLVSYGREFRSPRFFRGEEFQHTFEKAGKFVYTDVIYSDRESMRGIVVVEE